MTRTVHEKKLVISKKKKKKSSPRQPKQTRPNRESLINIIKHKKSKRVAGEKKKPTKQRGAIKTANIL